MGWKTQTEDGLEFRRISPVLLEGRLTSYSFTCFKHGIHVEDGAGEGMRCPGCGTDKLIRGNYVVLAYQSRDPERIIAALRRARKLPVPITPDPEGQDIRIEVNLDEGDE